VRTAAARGQLGDRALEFLSFISAGDALMAFDQAAPALGARISAADLRSLARIMAPHTTADPLQFNYEEDPELQHIFGFTPPPETPDSVEPSDSAEPETAATPSAAAGRIGSDAHGQSVCHRATRPQFIRRIFRTYRVAHTYGFALDGAGAGLCRCAAAA
jgi:hypothetical protein